MTEPTPIGRKASPTCPGLKPYMPLKIGSKAWKYTFYLSTKKFQAHAKAEHTVEYPVRQGEVQTDAENNGFKEEHS